MHINTERDTLGICLLGQRDYIRFMDAGSQMGLVTSAALPAVLTVEEVAELMRVDRKTAYSAIAEGGIPGVRRIGRCIRVSRDELLRWLAEGQGDMRGGRRR